jgi:hypothetical protein
MRRREVLGLVGGAAAGWPLVGRNLHASCFRSVEQFLRELGVGCPTRMERQRCS